jgi:CRISPR-associated protein Cse1 (CRISPR_cse1)
MGYRQWVSMLYGDKEGLREPAMCVSFFIDERRDDLPSSERSFRLSAAGYATDNMKALVFVETETPDLTITKAEEQVAQKAKDFVAAVNAAHERRGAADRGEYRQAVGAVAEALTRCVYTAKPPTAADASALSPNGCCPPFNNGALRSNRCVRGGSRPISPSCRSCKKTD